MESKEEVRLRDHYRRKMAQILYKNNTIQNETIFTSLTTAIFENRHVRNGTTKQWTFPGAFYFSTLVVTLIGKPIFKVNFNEDLYNLSRLRSNNTQNKYRKFFLFPNDFHR